MKQKVSVVNHVRHEEPFAGLTIGTWFRSVSDNALYLKVSDAEAFSFDDGKLVNVNENVYINVPTEVSVTTQE